MSHQDWASEPLIAITDVPVEAELRAALEDGGGGGGPPGGRRTDHPSHQVAAIHARYGAALALLDL